MKKTQLKQRLNEFSTKKGLSKNKLAEKLGVSPATLSNIENEHWDKLNDEMLLSISNSITTIGWSIVETANFQHVFNACTLAKNNHKMIGVVGFTGAGKTTALQNFYQSNKNTYYISCTKTMSAKQFLVSILREMGISYTGTVYDISKRITKELNKQTTPLLIIDEAGKLSQIIMEYIHDLRNDTEQSTGIVLVGVEYFKKNLEKSVNKEKEGMPEFYDRISAWVELQLPTKNEVRSLCAANNIQDLDFIKQMFKVRNYRRIANYITIFLNNQIA